MKKKIKPMRQIKRESVVTQSLDFSCGAAGLATLFNFYLEDPVSEVDIINTMLQITPLEKVKARRGFSMLDIKNYAKAKGYKATGYKMDIQFLKDLDEPVLVPISFRKYRHFVIVKDVIANRVFIADPAVGNMQIKVEQFEKMWTNGIGLLIQREGDDALRDYALKVDAEDFLVSDYRRMSTLINQTAVRNAIYPTEF